jgi:hypothetical protein
MEDDKELRKLLNEGVLLKASADFSSKVMAGIGEIKPTPINQAKEWKYVFSIIATLVVVATVVISPFINPYSLPHVYLETLYSIPTTYLITIAEYLGAFWLLLAISFLMNKNWIQKNGHSTSTS